jgi:hypothetical protein
METAHTSGNELGDSIYYRKYSEFWQNNLQSIEEIASSLQSSISRLEKKYADFDEQYEEIQKQIDVLSSMYAGYNVMLGRDYLLKLRALMKEYRIRYSHEGINFNAIHFLQQKIVELREKSFSGYPALTHEETLAEWTPVPVPIRLDPEQARFRWITFERSGFRFITAHNGCRVYGAGELPGGISSATGRPFVTHGTADIEITDLLPPLDRPPLPARRHVVVTRGDSDVCYAADRVFRTILAGSDVIIHGVRPVRAGRLRLGSVRLFGHRHFYIY